MFSSWLSFDNIRSTLEAKSCAILRADRTSSSESFFVFDGDTMAGGPFVWRSFTLSFNRFVSGEMFSLVGELLPLVFRLNRDESGDENSIKNIKTHGRVDTKVTELKITRPYSVMLKLNLIIQFILKSVLEYCYSQLYKL